MNNIFMYYPNLIVLNGPNFLCLEENFNWIISLGFSVGGFSNSS